MWTWMTGGQKFLLLVLFLTTFFGGFAYLCYLAISYRMERASPVLGPQILEREAAVSAAKAASQVKPVEAAFIGAGGLLAGAAGLVAIALISVASDHGSRPASTSQGKQATRVATAVVSDGCDLAGVAPNCKEAMAALRAKTESK
jgi:hypothetical protein